MPIIRRCSSTRSTSAYASAPGRLLFVLRQRPHTNQPDQGHDHLWEEHRCVCPGGSGTRLPSPREKSEEGGSVASGATLNIDISASHWPVSVARHDFERVAAGRFPEAEGAERILHKGINQSLVDAVVPVRSKRQNPILRSTPGRSGVAIFHRAVVHVSRPAQRAIFVKFRPGDNHVEVLLHPARWRRRREDEVDRRRRFDMNGEAGGVTSPVKWLPSGRSSVTVWSGLCVSVPR